MLMKNGKMFCRFLANYGTKSGQRVKGKSGNNFCIYGENS